MRYFCLLEIFNQKCGTTQYNLQKSTLNKYTQRSGKDVKLTGKESTLAVRKSSPFQNEENTIENYAKICNLS